ncbi:MAG TPA: SDR family oxidoreductase [Acidimicrobiales bacterium]|nr:SDR family oxidoreductase [Acidimicrobiales bacterium]
MVDEGSLSTDPPEGAPTRPMFGHGLKDRSILVVGASAGIGRCFAELALAQGGRVVATSRRADRLESLVGHSAHGHAVAGDVRNAEDCRRMVAEAVGALGQIDVVLYSAGVAPLRPMTSTTDEDWASVLETHVIGVHHIVQAVLGHLSPAAVVMVLSSETVGTPRTGLGAYGASKAALEETVGAWRNEHPLLRFSTAAIGATFPTEFGHAFDPDLLTETLNDWTRRGLMTERMLSPEDVAGTLVGILATALDYPGVGLEHIVVRPNSPVLGTSWGPATTREDLLARQREGLGSS